MARRTQGPKSAAYVKEIDPRFKVTPPSPPSEQTFELKAKGALLIAREMNQPLHITLENLMHQHQQAVTAAEVALLKKLKHGAGFIADTPRQSPDEGYYAVPIEDIDAELTKRGEK